MGHSLLYCPANPVPGGVSLHICAPAADSSLRGEKHSAHVKAGSRGFFIRSFTCRRVSAYIQRYAGNRRRGDTHRRECPRGTPFIPGRRGREEFLEGKRGRNFRFLEKIWFSCGKRGRAGVYLGVVWWEYTICSGKFVKTS